jgi:RNA polymerase sigma-70 factor (ECF subfamily)
MGTVLGAAVVRDRSLVAPLFSESRCRGDDERERRLTRRAVRRATGGDGDAMGELYTRYSGRVYGHVRRVLRDRHDAEDVTQLVFLKLIWSLDRYDERSGDFCAWLLRVARNMAIDEVRRRRPMLFGDLYTADARRDDEALEARGDALRAALADLSDDQREVLILRQVIGLSPGEIATRLNRSEGSVHALYHRARVAMKASLARADAAPATRARRAVAA